MLTKYLQFKYYAYCYGYGLIWSKYTNLPSNFNLQDMCIARYFFNLHDMSITSMPWPTLYVQLTCVLQRYPFPYPGKVTTVDTMF